MLHVTIGCNDSKIIGIHPINEENNLTKYQDAGNFRRENRTLQRKQ